MKLSLDGLATLCHSHVLEVVFVRRDKRKKPPTRRMLCTLNMNLLNSDFGKKVLNFANSKGYPIYSPTKRNLLTVWDLLMQDWRNIPVESAVVIDPAIPAEPVQNFIKYFNQKIAKMTALEKKNFMDH